MPEIITRSRPNLLHVSMWTQTTKDPYYHVNHVESGVDLRLGRTKHRVYAPAAKKGDSIPLKWGTAVSVKPSPKGTPTVESARSIDEYTMPFGFDMIGCITIGRSWSLEGLKQVIDIKGDKDRYLTSKSDWQRGAWPAVGLSQVVLIEHIHNRSLRLRGREMLAIGTEAVNGLIFQQLRDINATPGKFESLVNFAMNTAVAHLNAGREGS